MHKFTIPISKPANFGVSQQEVTELVTKLRSGLSGTHSGDRPSGSGQGEVQVPTSPAAPLARVR
jgi:hypothetical protein